MSATLVLAGVLAGLSVTFLGLVDAGRQLDATLSRLEREADTLHRATANTVEHGGPVEAMTRPRTSLERMIDALGSNAARAVDDAAPPYTRGISRSIGDAIALVPGTDAIDAIKKAYGDYLEQSKQAQAEAARTPAAADLTVRLLDLSHENLAQRITDARERTKQAVARALNGLQLITFISIGIAALAVGLTGER